MQVSKVKYSILDEMVEDHDKVAAIAKDARSRRKPDIVGAVKRLRNEMERHMVVEEKAVFTMYDGDNGGVVRDLVRQHKEMLDALRSVESDLEAGWKPDFAKFDLLWHAHRNFEEESFYPELDKSLTAEQRRKIIDEMRAPLE